MEEKERILENHIEETLKPATEADSLNETPTEAEPMGETPTPVETKKLLPKRAEKRRRKPTSGKTPLSHRLGMKVLAFITAVLMVFVVLGGSFGAHALWELDVYTKPKSEMKEESFRDISYNLADDIIRQVVDSNYNVGGNDFWRHGNLSRVEIHIDDGPGWVWGNEYWDRGNMVFNKTFAAVCNNKNISNT